MERLSKLELQKMVMAGVITNVFVTKSEGLYRVAVSTKNAGFVLKSQRDDMRKFKTITSAQSLLLSVGISSFTVLG